MCLPLILLILFKISPSKVKNQCLREENAVTARIYNIANEFWNVWLLVNNFCKIGFFIMCFGVQIRHWSSCLGPVSTLYQNEIKQYYNCRYSPILWNTNGACLPKIWSTKKFAVVLWSIRNKCLYIFYFVTSLNSSFSHL